MKYGQDLRPPGWFTLVAILALGWNLAGFSAWWSLARPASGVGEAGRYLQSGLPGWAITALGIAICCGTLGSLALLRRQRLAIGLLMLSLLAMLGFAFAALVATLGAPELPFSAVAGPAAGVLVAAYLLILSMQARNHGWLGQSGGSRKAKVRVK